MSARKIDSDQASDRGRFAAREFVARYVREVGRQPPVEFAYEMGYLRGRSDAAHEASEMFEEIARTREEARRKSDDETE